MVYLQLDIYIPQINFWGAYFQIHAMLEIWHLIVISISI